MDNVVSLFLLYARPVLALSRILDRGRIWFSLLAAAGVSVLLHAFDSVPRVPAAPVPGFLRALFRFLSYEPGAVFFPIACVAIVLVPAILAVRAALGFGSFGVLMRSDYLPLLICVLMSWSAAYLPLAVAGMLIQAHWLPVYAAASLYFVVLTALSVRTVLGTGFAAAAGMTAVGWVAGVGGGALFAIAGSVPYFLMSPFILYYFYMAFGSDVRSLGQGLRSRQDLLRQLQISTNNPKDADAHYQLGLIYQQRRQYTEAIARFERSVEIDPSEAEPHFYLGCIARQQGRFEDAIRHLKAAAAINDKLLSSDVWRELGAAYFGASRLEEAEAALEKYTTRHAYDPEGLCWYGMTMARLGKKPQAKELFERCIDAVNTMPSNRRAHMRTWASQAKTELRALR